MAQATRTFRIFVSSTFHDLKDERNALQEHVFPRLRQLCMQHGARFQAIDLRWGVSEQASLDQQAMNVCLGEIARCQRTTPRPNFIVLLGDRYGWRPLPSEIPADEFEEIERRVTEPEAKKLLKAWYLRDDNALYQRGDDLKQGIYVLQPRTGEFEDYEVWDQEVERPLHNILAQATEGMDLTPEQRLKYVASATHQEIVRGALQVEDAPDHVFCFFRNIGGLPQDEKAKGFLDLDVEGNPDGEARQLLKQLKAELRQLLPGNVHEYEAMWTSSGASTDHIVDLCEDVYERLSQVILEEVGAFILEEVEQPEKIDPLELEITEHEKFGRDRAKFFVGREEILETIAEYVRSADPHPLGVWGKSGSGKSALMAKAIQQAIKMHPNAKIVFRFIGATPESSNGRALLESLCRQISRRYGEDESSVPADYRELVADFSKRLALATPTPAALAVTARATLTGHNSGVYGVAVTPDGFRVVSASDDKTLKIWDLNSGTELATFTGHTDRVLGVAVTPDGHRAVSASGDNTLKIWDLDGGNELATLTGHTDRVLGVAVTPDGRQALSASLDKSLKLWDLDSGTELATLTGHTDRVLGVAVTPDGRRAVSASVDKTLKVWDLHSGIELGTLAGHTAGVIHVAVTPDGRRAVSASHDKTLSIWDLDGGTQLATLTGHTDAISGVAITPDSRRAVSASGDNTLKIWDLDSGAELATLTGHTDVVRAVAVTADGHGAVSASWDKTLKVWKLALATAEEPLILFLDALDQLSDADNARNLAWLPRELSQHVRLVVSTLAVECRSVLEGILPPGNLVELEPMPPEQGSQLLDLWLRDAKRTLQQHQREEVLGKFNQEGNGLPLYLKLAFEEARRWKSYADPADTTLGADVPGVIRDLFARLSAEGNHGQMLVSRSLGYLAAAKNGLTEDEMLDVLSRDVELYAWFLESLYHTPPDLLQWVREQLESTPSVRPREQRDQPIDEKVAEEWLKDLRRDRTRLMDFLSTVLAKPDPLRLPVVLWSRLYFDLEPYLTQRSGDNTALLSFYHRQLGEVTGEEYLSGEDKPRRHRALAHYFGVQSLRIDTDEQKTPNLRKLSELPYQQAYAQMWDEVQATLTNFDFLQTKIEEVGPLPLIGDYDEADNAGLDSGPLRQVQRAVRLSAHVLVEDPLQTPAQLTGRLLSSDLPAIRSLLDQMLSWDRPWLRPLVHSLSQPGGALIRTLAGHTEDVSGVAVTPDGLRVVSGSWDGTLRVWDLDTGTELATLTPRTVTDSIPNVQCVAVTPDGLRVVSGSWDGTLKVWDLETGTRLATLWKHHDGVEGVAVTPDGRRVISASRDKKLKVWDLDTGTRLATLTGHTETVSGVAVTPDGRRAISASRDETLKVWDLDAGTELATLTGHTDWVLGVAVTPDGRRALSASRDKTLKVWDLDAGTELAALIGHTSGVTAVRVTPDGYRAISSSWDDTLKVWELDSGAELSTLTGHTNSVSSVAITPDGRRAVSASWDRTVKVWNLEAGTELATLSGHSSFVGAVAVTPDGRRAVSCGDETLKVWDLDTGSELATLRGHSKFVGALEITPDGRRAISASADKTLKLWDLDSSAELDTLTGHTDEVNKVAVTADGRRAVSASDDKTLKVWDLETGNEVATLTGHRDKVEGVAITADGRRAVSASDDKTLKVWDLNSGTELATLTGHRTSVSAVTVTPDGRRAVSIAPDRTLKLWDLDTGTELATLTGHTRAVYAVAMTPDGRRAISASFDETLKVWDLDSGTELATLTGHSNSVLAVAVTPDGRRAVSASLDNTIRVWNLESFTEFATFTGDGASHSCAISPDGSTIVAGEESGRVHFLRLEGIEPLKHTIPTSSEPPRQETNGRWRFWRK